MLKKAMAKLFLSNQYGNICSSALGYMGGIRVCRAIFHNLGFHARFFCNDGHRESMKYDVVVVGAGPAGLSAAIRLKHLCRQRNTDFSVCVVEKGAEVGAHILSGNVFETRALDELLPQWKEEVGAFTPVSSDKFWFLTKNYALSLPSPFDNKGNYVISLSQLVRWMGTKAEELGVDIYPGFSATEILHDVDDTVVGVATGDMGVAKDGLNKETFQAGVELRAAITLVAEGCRGSLSEKIINKYNLRGKVNAQHQTYALGIKEVTHRWTHVYKDWTHTAVYVPFRNARLDLKEGRLKGEGRNSDLKGFEAKVRGTQRFKGIYGNFLQPFVWQVDRASHSPGSVLHTIGWPLDHQTYGGSFLYHMKDNQVSVGLVVALNYRNPFMNPYEEFQKLKHHPSIRHLFEGGTVLQYGARALNEGGFQSVPYTVFPGGAILGCAAGFLNVRKMKGTHTAMKSGMLAADAAFGVLHEKLDMEEYWENLRTSWIWDELRESRNYRPAFKYGLFPGLAFSALEHYMMKGRSPITLNHGKPDHQATEEGGVHFPITYPKPDGAVSFDIPTSLYRSNTDHEYNQPCHLRLRDPKIPEVVNFPIYAGPESRYCPARVYEYSHDEDGQHRLHISAQNCLHCKACDIKDPKQNIQWTPPEGGGGPGYSIM